MIPFCPFCGHLLSLTITKYKNLPKNLTFKIFNCYHCSNSLFKQYLYDIKFIFNSSNNLSCIKHIIRKLDSRFNKYARVRIIQKFNPDSTEIFLFKSPIISTNNILPICPSNIIDKLNTYLTFS